MKFRNCFNSNFIKLLALVHVAVALFSYYYFFFLYNRQYNQPAEVNNISRRSYEFFYFVQTWPGSFKPQPKKVRADFTIHGLWPEGGHPSENCNPNNPLNLSNIATLKEALMREWQALNQKNFSSNEDFWKYEWKQHGTCSEDVLDQFKYFNTSLDLKCKTDILQTLKKAGIKPDTSKEYPLKNIWESLERQVGYAPRIVCNRNRQIYEIRFCVNPEGTNFTRCSGGHKNCTDKVKFPPYPSNINYSPKDESPLQQAIIYYNETLE